MNPLDAANAQSSKAACSSTLCLNLFLTYGAVQKAIQKFWHNLSAFGAYADDMILVNAILDFASEKRCSTNLLRATVTLDD